MMPQPQTILAPAMPILQPIQPVPSIQIPPPIRVQQPNPQPTQQPLIRPPEQVVEPRYPSTNIQQRSNVNIQPQVFFIFKYRNTFYFMYLLYK